MYHILNFLFAFLIFQQIQLFVCGNVKLTVWLGWWVWLPHLEHLIFPYALASVILWHNHTEFQLGGGKMIVENLGEGDEMLTGILSVLSGDACLLWILSELWKLFSVKLHVLCSDMRFWDPRDLHSSLQNHNKWSLPQAGRQDKWSVPKLFSRWCLSSEQHHHFKCKAHNGCLPAWQMRPPVLLTCFRLPSCKMLPSVKTLSQASLK